MNVPYPSFRVESKLSYRLIVLSNVIWFFALLQNRNIFGCLKPLCSIGFGFGRMQVISFPIILIVVFWRSFLTLPSMGVRG